jgi:uncharacterized membrane protein YeaQ/YmgE (transglycosylase-associated protein family)
LDSLFKGSGGSNYIIVAVVGAFLAGYFLNPLVRVGTISDVITIPTMLVTLLGSVLLLVIVYLTLLGETPICMAEGLRATAGDALAKSVRS